MSVDVSLSPLQEPTGTASAQSGAAEGEISMLDLLIVLAEKKRKILSVTLIFGVVGLALSFILPERYTSSVVLLPPQQNSSLGAGIASQLGSLGGMAALAGGGLAGGALSLKNPNDQFVGMLKSRTVEDAMIQRFGLMQEYRSKYESDAREKLEKRVTIEGSGKDGLIRISVEDKDPNRAAELANGYVDQFRKLSEHLAITEAAQRRLFFEQQLEEEKDRLANAEEALKQTEQKTGLIQLDSQARALIQSAAALRGQIAAKEVQIQSMRTFATSENAQLVQAQQELDGLRAQLKKLGGSEEGSDTDLMMPKGRVPQAGLEYIRKVREVKYEETIFEILARQFEVAKLDEAKQGSLIQVVDAGVPPDKRSFPKRTFIVLGAVIAGFIVGICSVIASASIGHLKLEPAIDAKLLYLRQMMSWRGHHTA